MRQYVFFFLRKATRFGQCQPARTVNTFYSSKLKEVVDDNFEFDKDDRNFIKQVENTVGKGEIARY